MRDDNPDHKRTFYDLLGALGEYKFLHLEYTPEVIGGILLDQYEYQCDKIGKFYDNISSSVPTPMVTPSVAVWQDTLEQAFSRCVSAKAKRYTWTAIAIAAVTYNEAQMLKLSAGFLQRHESWRPKNMVAHRIGFFAGVYTPEDYRLPVLLASSQRMQLGDSLAKEHIAQWLHSLCMPIGMLPLRNVVALAQETPENFRINQTLWWDVVVPFCQQYPNENVVPDRVFFYLPIVPGKETGCDLIQSLPQPHQQWAYANIRFPVNEKIASLQFWEEAFPKELTATEQHLRLHLAIYQLGLQQSKYFAEKIDPDLVGMLESLGDYSEENLQAALRARWMHDVATPATLPDGLLDDAELSFNL